MPGEPKSDSMPGPRLGRLANIGAKPGRSVVLMPEPMGVAAPEPEVPDAVPLPDVPDQSASPGAMADSFSKVTPVGLADEVAPQKLRSPDRDRPKMNDPSEDTAGDAPRELVGKHPEPRETLPPPSSVVKVSEPTVRRSTHRQAMAPAAVALEDNTDDLPALPRAAVPLKPATPGLAVETRPRAEPEPVAAEIPPLLQQATVQSERENLVDTPDTRSVQPEMLVASVEPSAPEVTQLLLREDTGVQPPAPQQPEVLTQEIPTVAPRPENIQPVQILAPEPAPEKVPLMPDPLAASAPPAIQAPRIRISVGQVVINAKGPAESARRAGLKTIGRPARPHSFNLPEFGGS